MDTSNINITVHAIKRFMLRHEKAGLGTLTLDEANTKMLELIRTAKLSQIGADSFFADDIVLINKGWRFVVSADGTALMTVERIHCSQN